MNVDKGDAVTRTEYKPYGETWVQEGDKTNRPKFNSQELDPETGYYFYNARYYEAEIGRFITADNIIPEEYSTQSWNRFSYCYGNPVRYKDPTGHDPADEVTRFLVDFKGFLEDTADSQLSVAKERGSNGDIVGASFWGFCGAANGAASFFLPEDRSDIELALLTAGLAQPAVVKTAKKGVKTAEKALDQILKSKATKKGVQTFEQYADDIYIKAMKIAKDKKNFQTPKNKGAVYSGKGNHSKVMKYADKNNLIPIDLTKGGRKFDELGNIYDILGQDKADEVMGIASKNYASGLSGTVHKFIRGHDPSRVYGQKEAHIIEKLKQLGVVTDYVYHK